MPSESPTVVVEYSIEEFFNLILALKWWCPETHWRFLVLNNIDFQINVSPVVEAWFHPSRYYSEVFNFWQTSRLKSCQLFSLQQKPDGRKNPKGAMFFDLTRWSNSVFSEATGSISWIKTPSDFFVIVTNQSNKKQSIVFLASESWLFQCSKNWIWWWLNLIFKLDILCSYRVRFPIIKRVKNSTVLEESSIRSFFIWVPASRSWCPKTLWRFVGLNYLNLQSHVPPYVEVWFGPSKCQRKSYHLRQTFRKKRCRFSSFQQKPDGSIVPKGAMNFDLSRYWNSIFSKTTGFRLQIRRLKNSRFYSLRQKPDSTKVPKFAFCFGITSYSNLIFCVATGLDSPIFVPIEIHIHVEEDSYRDVF